MKFKIILVLFATLIQLTQAESKNPAVENRGVIPTRSVIFPSYTGVFLNYRTQPVTWYLKLNLTELNNSNLLDSFMGKNYKFSQNSSFNFKKTLPNEISKIWLYGNTFKYSENVTMVIEGSLSDSTLLKLIHDEFYTVNGITQLRAAKTQYSNGHEIFVFDLVNPNDKHKKKYAARLADGSFIISNNKNEVRRLLRLLKKDNIWFGNNQNINKPDDRDLLVFNINTEIALKNAQLNLEKDGYVMQSQLFKKAKHIVTTAHMENGQVMLKGALITNESSIAIQMEKILNGIAAYNALSESNSVQTIQSELIKNLTVERKDKIVYLETFISPEQFRSENIINN